MGIPELLSHADVTERLQYDPLTGSLTWRHRTKEQCAKNVTSSRPGAAARAASLWNGKYAGKQAGQLKTPATGKPYYVVAIYGKAYRAHKLIYFLVNKVWPEHLDFKDYDRCNLEYANMVASGTMYPEVTAATIPQPPSVEIPAPPGS